LNIDTDEPPAPPAAPAPSSAAALARAAATAFAGAQQYPRPALYLVATPIGNLADFTLRALAVLERCDAIACEDTRVAASLMAHFGLPKKPLFAAHAHNEAEAAVALLERLARGEAVAFVSDAGTPAVSDPGARLVAAAQAAGVRVVPVPGASSALAALSAAGDTAGDGGFVFGGFVAARGREREAALAAIADEPRAQVLFEAPHRIEALLEALARAAPARRLTIARELTKQFESITTLPAGEAPAWLAADPMRRKGEFVLVWHAAPRGKAAEGEPGTASLHALHVLLEELPLKQAVAIAAKLGGAPRNALYAAALAMRGDSEAAGE
jgi:16S rRNA (cytidine1402-2'-O)-methyltransferase